MVTKRRFNALMSAFLSALLILAFFPCLPSAYAAASRSDYTPVTVNSDGKASSSAYIDTTTDDQMFAFQATPWGGSYDYFYLRVISDSCSGGYSYVSDFSRVDEDNTESEPNVIAVCVGGAGTHNIVVRCTFYDSNGKALHYDNYSFTITLKKTHLSRTYLATYVGKTTTLKAYYLTGDITWKSTTPSVASISTAGVVTPKKLGRTTISVTGVARGSGKTVTMRCLVEVTYKKAYCAVLNAWTDYKNSKLKYSQPKRMSKNYRDCSSFVSRCYYDASLGRTLYAIGGTAGKSWALNAAAQAKWLYKNGKKVAWAACSESKLLPGDTVYFETDYAGKDSSQWRYIDHAGLYVGNGIILGTGGYTEYGCVGMRYYSTSDTSIKFIGRPLG